MLQEMIEVKKMWILTSLIQSDGDLLFFHQVRSTSLMTRPLPSSQPGLGVLSPAHQQSHQLVSCSAPQPPTLGRSHSCPFCFKHFYGSVDLERHKRTHTGEKPFACPHCSYRATQLGNLQRHIKSKHPNTPEQIKHV